MSEPPSAGDLWRLRPLMAAPARPPPPPPVNPSPQHRVPKQANTTTACHECRKLKSKCSGERPACRRCVLRRTPCHYTTRPGETNSQALKRGYDDLRDQATTHKEVLELLKSLPDAEAVAILQRLRSGTDMTTILNHVNAGNLLLQLAVVPETRTRYDFPYRSQMPQNYLPDNPYLDSLIYDPSSLYSPAQSPSLSGYTTSSLATNLPPAEYRSLYLKPFHAANVVDPLLTDARPSLWTAVCDDDVLMRDLLTVFFRCEYHFTAAFQKDYFLEDMAAQRHDFCSSLLVNVTLAYACVCYPLFTDRAEYWNPHTLLYRFLAEAKRIWELEATKPRITTIQAGILFNVFHNLCGLDEIGQAYRIQAIVLARKLHLFDDLIDGQSERIRNGKTYAAWALYIWEALVGFSFMIPPLLKTPPKEPMPDPAHNPQWYGEIWVKYPLNQSLLPSYFGLVFKAKCQFRVIMSEFCQAAYSEGSTVSLGKANELYSRLRGWYSDLPPQLQPKAIVLPGHLQLHMYYHNLILSIYEPLLDMETDQDPSPQEIVNSASKHLYTLVRLYYLRHGFDAMDLFIVIPLVLAGYKCINDINEHPPVSQLEDLRSTLILITKGLYEQRRNHYLAEALFRVIRGRMRPQEVALLKDTIDPDGKMSGGQQDMIQAVRSHWPVSVVRKKEDLNSHILENLVEEYAHLNV